VPPQTMVISTSTHSALLNREKRGEEFADVMTLHTTLGGRTMRRMLRSILPNPTE
jgi:hypothetical protein